MIDPAVVPDGVACSVARLEGAEVWVGFARLDRAAAEVAELRGILAADERARADRFVQDIHRNRFVVARATLRLLIAAQFRIRAEEVAFRYGDHGKPFLAGELDGALHLNVSHSEDVALYAFCDVPVGCDIEAIRPVSYLDGIVSRWFAPEECDAILGGPAEARERMFFRYWTLKEAVMKGIGRGISLLSREFTLHDLGDGRHRASGEGELPQWSAFEYPAPEGFAAAIAIETGAGEL